MKKTIYATMLILSFTLGLKLDTMLERENAYAEEKEIFVEKLDDSSQQEKSEYNQDSIYSADSNNGVRQMPLKAIKDTYNHMDYFLLSDGQGSFYVTQMQLIDGENYVGYVDSETDELMSFSHSTFTFDYEEYWHNELNVEAEKRVGREIMKEEMKNIMNNI